MTKKARVAFISKTLDECFPGPAIPLDHATPFQLLVAVVLSAQCTDAAVNKATPALFKKAPTAQKMAKLDADEIYLYIKSLTYGHSKSNYLHDLSEKLVHEFGGEVPQSFEALESLPGVGHKSASVLMSQAFGIPAFPVDTHIHRLAHRWGLSDGSTVERTEADLKKIWPNEEWEKRHLQMIYFGRKYCPAKGHKPEECPVCSEVGLK
jgi:endonuclease-3